ncbi:MAG: phage late control D family protein [Polyangiaceae bacterium]
MSGTDRSAPGVRVTSLSDPTATSGTPIDLGMRILAFTYEASDVRVEKMSLELDNFDGALFDRPELLGGALLEVSWGYPGNMAPPRRVVVTKLKGFTSLTVEGQGLAVLWNDQTKTMRWTSVTRSDVARAVAASHGYEGSSLHIDDTEERFDVINQAAETDAWLLRRLAAKEHFRFAIEGGVFHFHARKNAAAPDVVLTYYADLARGDIQRLSVESDLTRRVGSVTVRGRDPMNKVTLESKSNAQTAERGTLGDVLEVFDKETGASSVRPWNATESVQPSAAASPTQTQREADARFTKAEMATVVLSADVVGDPALRAGAIVELQGLPPRIAGKYRIREAKHQITGSGYAVALKLTRDAVGKVPPGVPSKPQGGEHNDAQPKTDGTLDWVQQFDKETGAEVLESRSSGQPLGSGDPEGAR